LPILAVFAVIFLGIMGYFLSVGFGVTGSVFGKTAKAGGPPPAAGGPGTNNVEGGGPPATVMLQIKTLRDRIAAHPNDDVAITQLADMELAANRFEAAIPLYQRALKINPHNVAAKAGLDEAHEGLQESAGQ
jgi:hypothetical protein